MATQYKLAEVELNKIEVSQIKRAIADMNLEIVVCPSERIGYDLVSEDRSDLMDLFDLICFELNFIEEDIIEV